MKKYRSFKGKGNSFKKIVAMAIISMTVVSAITGCSQDTDTDSDSAFQPLDVEQLESDTTDIDDRAEYYEKNVDYNSVKATIMNDENAK